MSGRSFTVAAQASAPYVHVDERALVLCDGPLTVLFEQARRRWAAETLEILLAEGRATRTQSERTLGGVVDGDRVTLYAFAGHGGGLSLTLSVQDARALQDALRG